MAVKIPTIYSQFDPAWSRILLGYNTDPQYDIYNYGCLLCCLAMIARYYGKDTTPARLNEELKKTGGYTVGSGLYVDGGILKVYPDLREEVTRMPTEPLTDMQMAQIRLALDGGSPVMLKIDYNPQTIKPDDHFVLALAYNPVDENDITIADPLGGRLHSLRDYLTAAKNARVTIAAFYIYTGPIQTLPIAVSNPITPSLPPNYDDIIRKASGYDELAKSVNLESTASLEQVRDAFAQQVKVYEKIVEKPVEIIKEVIKEVPISTPATDTDRAMAYILANWKDTLAYLEIDKLPDAANIADIKRVVAGIKSRTGDFERQRNQLRDENAKLKTDVTNLEGDVSRLEKEVLSESKLHKAQLDALVKNQPDYTQLTRQYHSVTEELRKDLEAAIGELKGVRLELAQKQTTLETVSDTVQKRSIPIITPLWRLLGSVIKLQW